MIEPLKDSSQPSVLRDSYVKPLSIIHIIGANASFASSKHKVALDSQAGTCVASDSCLVINDYKTTLLVYILTKGILMQWPLPSWNWLVQEYSKE